ncbi:MAG: molecular chaperone DnaJ, partial [Desulfobulbaceae bacterium]|nr:molecular chaperone DnaJ [Desulfobulbaceae bacterium]
RTKNRSQTKNRYRKNSNNSVWDAEKLYRGPLPSRRLLLGHYLYYSGIINWRTIIKALVWQRTNRPRLGEIGRNFGWLSETDIPTILKTRKPSKKFGQSAIDLGLLTKIQLKMIIFQQKRLQKKIGEYFTKSRILTHTQLYTYINECRQHNKMLAESLSKNGFTH